MFTVDSATVIQFFSLQKQAIQQGIVRGEKWTWKIVELKKEIDNYGNYREKFFLFFLDCTALYIIKYSY